MATATVNTERLRSLAEGLDREIDNKLASRQENTPKRQREAAAARIDGHHLQRVQRALIALADAHDQGRCPPILQDIRTKSDVFGMVKTRTGSHGYYDVHDTGEYSDQSPKAKALRDLMENTISEEERAKLEETARLSKIRDAEAKLRFADIPGFFPTPRTVIEMMLDRLNFDGEGTLLEPSAGTGSILEVAQERYPNAQLLYCEKHFSLCEILEMKGFRGFRGDFMDQEPSPEIDAIRMNPPFENGQDADHIRRAYDWLKPGGSLVAIASASVLHNTRNKYGLFREWLGLVDAQYENLPAGSFDGKDAFKQTGVNTVMIWIRKPQQVTRSIQLTTHGPVGSGL